MAKSKKHNHKKSSAAEKPQTQSVQENAQEITPDETEPLLTPEAEIPAEAAEESAQETAPEASAQSGTDDLPDPFENAAEESETLAEQPEESAQDGGEDASNGEDEDTGGEDEDADGEDEDYYDDEEYEDYFTRRRRRRRKRKKKGRGLSCALVLLTLILAVSTVLSVAILAVAKEMYGIDKDITEKVITIPSGATTADIALQLQNEHMINLPQVFRLISRLNGMDGSYIAGEHIISPSMSYQAMIEELCKNHTNDREYVTVTFREGITLLDAARILEENEVCSADDFLFFFDAGGYDFEFESHLPDASALKFHRMEGYCFPDTYDFYVDEDPSIVAQKIYDNFNSKITEADYAKMDELNMTLDEVITLASIVQAEAPTASSMRMVASVFHNRLISSALFPKLQSDPTRIYAEQVIAPNLQIENTMMLDAYNTYTSAGLPPGAINNPGREAIEAVLYPASSTYYFFCANVQTGEIFYAETNEEHEANLRLIAEQQAAAGLTDD